MPAQKTNSSLSQTAAPHKAVLLKIFFAALALRWIYALAMYCLMGDDGLKGVDSFTYAGNGKDFAEALRAGAVHGSQWLGPYPYTMPLYQWLTTLPFLFFGAAGTITHILFQGALDAGTCVIVYLLARDIDQKVAFWAAIAAVLNPTQIVLSGLMYNDTPFSFFVILAVYFCARWTAKPGLTWAAAIGGALGCAALIRVSIVPWAFLIIGILFLYSLFRRRKLHEALTVFATAIILCTSLGLISLRSASQYGTYALTPQGGDYLALWIYPLAKEAQDRTPYQTSLDDTIARTTERFGPPSANPFEQSLRYQQMGRELMRDIHVTSLVKSWLSGIFINLASPAHLISPSVSQLPRSGFYGTPGNSFFEKVFNYAFRSGNALYSWLLISGAAGLLVIRVVQIIGLVSLARQKRLWPMMLFGAIWIGYLLVLNGPIASPKYRVPLEPMFDILTGAGLVAARRRTNDQPLIGASA